MKEKAIANMDPVMTPDVVPGAAFDDPFGEVADQMPVSIPFLKIAYPGSPDRPGDAQPGDLYHSETSEVYPAATGLNVVLVALKSAGNAWQPKYDPKLGEDQPAPWCFSVNGFEPVTGDEEWLKRMPSDPQPGPCKRMINGKWEVVCPKLEWGGPKGARVPPECVARQKMLLWNLDADSPMIFTLKKKAITAIHKLYKAFKYQRGQLIHSDAKYRDAIPPQFLHKITITTRPEGTYYLPTMKLDKEFLPVECAQAIMEQAGIFGTAPENDAE